MDNQEAEIVEQFRVTTDPGQEPVRIDKYLMGRMEKVTRSKIQNGIKDERVLVNGKPIKSNYKIRPLDEIVVSWPKPRFTEGVIAEDIPLDIVYEDDDILVVNKPAGMVVHPGVGNHTGTLVNAVKFYLQNQNLPVMEGNLSDRPGLVHRIDKDTSGLLVLAKKEDAMVKLAKQFYDHSIERKYVALIWGQPDELEGTIEGHIGRHPTDRLRQTVVEDQSKGKHAITHYKILLPMYYVSLAECTLETGRTHQIRVHMKSAGHTLFNDARYGGNKVLKGTVYSKYKHFVENCFKELPRQALHAKSLGFIHPTTGEKMFFESELPEDFANCLDKWQKYLEYRKDKR